MLRQEPCVVLPTLAEGYRLTHLSLVVLLVAVAMGLWVAALGLLRHINSNGGLQ
jgi:hypothetical protein